MGSFDTDAFGVLLRMKSKFYQVLNNSFMLSSQPQAGVSKHPTRMFMPACKSLLEGRGQVRVGLPVCAEESYPHPPTP